MNPSFQFNYDRITKLREEAQRILEKYPEKRVQAFTGNLEALLEELSIYQIELEMQNEELRDLQTKLEDSQSDYRAFYHESPIGILQLNNHGNILQANPAAIKILKLDNLAFMPEGQMGLTALVHNEDTSAFMNHISTSAESSESQSICVRIRQKSDQWITFLMVSRKHSKPTDQGPIIISSIVELPS